MDSRAVLSLYRQCLRLAPRYIANPTVNKYFRKELFKQLRSNDVSDEESQQIQAELDKNNALLVAFCRNTLRGNFSAPLQPKHGETHYQALGEALAAGEQQLAEVLAKLKMDEQVEREMAEASRDGSIEIDLKSLPGRSKSTDEQT